MPSSPLATNTRMTAATVRSSTTGRSAIAITMHIVSSIIAATTAAPPPTIIPPPEIVADHDDPEQETPPPPLDYWETIYTVGMIYMKIAVNTVKKYWNEFRTFVINQIGYTVAP